MTMNEKKVLLTISGRILDSANDSEAIELKTQGLSFREGPQDCLSYEETELFGMEGTKTTILVNRDLVTIVRLGTVNSELEFKPGRRNVTLYATPYGEIEIGIVTNRLDITYTEDHWIKSVLIDYSIEIGNGSPLHNTIDIKVDY